jgi:nitrate reductase alpha subunit
VKDGLVTWETQQTDYPRTRPDLPNHEPRGCPRGASYSWYIYSANRLKHAKVRRKLIELWRAAKLKHSDPVEAWKSIVEDPDKAKSYKQQRGLGGFIRASWTEVNEIIAAANVYTAKTYGPDRITGFSPIPAMSMVSYAAHDWANRVGCADNRFAGFPRSPNHLSHKFSNYRIRYS